MDPFRSNEESMTAEVRRLAEENEQLREATSALNIARRRMWFWRLIGVLGVPLLLMMVTVTVQRCTNAKEGCVFTCTLPTEPTEDDLSRNFSCRSKKEDWTTYGDREALKYMYTPSACRFAGGVWNWGIRSNR